MLLAVCACSWGLAQTDQTLTLPQLELLAADSLLVSNGSDSIPNNLPLGTEGDSLLLASDSIVPKPKRKPLFDAQIKYNAVDSMVLSMEDGKQVAYLYGEAKVEYGSIELTAGYIRIEFETKEIFATGITDSLGKMIQKPHFKEASEEFDCTSLRYNFVTAKGFVENVISSQQDGVVQSERAKMLSRDVFCMVDGKYSTCDAEHPHFYLNITKGKLIGKRAIITGPSYLVLEDFPIYPIFLPFGYIPTNNTTYSSGIIVPSYGEELQYGYYLRDGGFYWAASDFFDVTVKGDIYSKGSWGAKLGTNYRWRYHFSGSFNFNVSKNVTGESGIDQSASRNFSVGWTHQQDSKASLSSNFSASVNFSTSGYDRANEYYNPQSYLTNSKQSRISYSKKFLNTPFNFSAVMAHSQNSIDTTISLTLPDMTLNMSTIYPFKKKNRVGKAKPWEDISLSYNLKMANSVKAKEYDLLSTPFSSWKKTVTHSLPISLPSMRLFNYVQLNPGFSYGESWYFETKRRSWVDGYEAFNNITGQSEWVKGHVQEIVNPNAFKRVYNYSYSVNSNTTLYGMYQMKNPNSKLVAVRHMVKPSVGFSYRPDFGQERFGFYDWVQTDSLGTYQQYALTDGAPGTGRSGSVNFGLSNNIEMKLLNSEADTTSKERYRKVAIFDDLSFNGSYNLAADSMNLSIIGWTARTKIAGFNLNVTGSIDPYYYDPVSKRRINQFMWDHASGIGKLGRLATMNTGFGYNFSSDKFKKKKENKQKGTGEKPAEGDEAAPEEKHNGDPLYDEYRPFDLPWSFSFNYTFGYSNNGIKPTVNQSLSFNGNITLSPKWSADFSSGFDFKAKKLTHTNMSVRRNLHCWSMAFSFAPIGLKPYYSFTLNANASMLKDLKVNKMSRPY